MQEPTSANGEDDLDSMDAYSFTEDTSDGGDEGDLLSTGVEVPDD